jgi:hypothetical protein
MAISTGGGAFVIREFNGHAVQIDGRTGTLIVEGPRTPTHFLRTQSSMTRRFNTMAPALDCGEHVAR